MLKKVGKRKENLLGKIKKIDRKRSSGVDILQRVLPEGS